MPQLTGNPNSTQKDDQIILPALNLNYCDVYTTVEKAATFLSQVTQLALKSKGLISKHPNARWLPYSLLDETLKTLVEEIKGAKARLGKSKSTTSVQQEHLEKALAGLEDVHQQLEQDIQLYLENVERESIF
ncbi:hypothetical protein BG000_005674 [Podila horticola]|nr:hypothetical protein BG000_005674 [Podila horticola]